MNTGKIFLVTLIFSLSVVAFTVRGRHPRNPRPHSCEPPPGLSLRGYIQFLLYCQPGILQEAVPTEPPLPPPYPIPPTIAVYTPPPPVAYPPPIPTATRTPRPTSTPDPNYTPAPTNGCYAYPCPEP